ncbi:MAG: hypothetical protein CVV27_12645 [Candidatus Melainabacteria bacterium HGW-Melainabacteria-1]|nr:MAG: hypothetical protein CVV27_12645 [Candidatus Melainabacteria bacterium HGW-Melainabacteria-1]
MTMFTSRLRHLALATTLVLGLHVSPALATLDQTLAPYPDDALALVTISLDPTNWSYLISKATAGGKITVKTKPADDQADSEKKTEASSDGETELPAEVNALIEFFQNDLKFDPLWDGIANLGSHLTLAYRNWPDSQGQLMFSLNLRSPDRVNQLMQRLHTGLQAKGLLTELAKDKFGPSEIYTLQTDNDDFEEFGQIHFAVSGQNLVGTIGKNPDLLKRMLYIQQVLPKHSGFRLANNPTFSPVRKSLQDKAVWGYVDIKQSLQAFDVLDELGDADSDEMAMVGQLTSLIRGIGIGLDIERDGLKFKSFVAPDWQNLSPKQQEYLSAMQREPEHQLTALMGQACAAQCWSKPRSGDQTSLANRHADGRHSL